MGVEVELGVGSDTGTLRGGSGGRRAGFAVRGPAAKNDGARPHPSLRKWLSGGLFAALVVACGHGTDGASADAGAVAAGSPERAEALIAGAPLPERLETVALADAVALGSVRARLDPAAAPSAATERGRSLEGARLARVAADLRRRLWRFDRTTADAHEAAELYSEAARLAAGSEEGCEADRRRALLVGELAGDAATSYREIYLVSRRQSALAVPPREGEAAPSAVCLARLDRALAQAVAYRPAADAMRALEREGDAASQAPSKAIPAPPAASSAPPPIDPTAAPTSSAAAAAAGPTADVVVSPDESATSKGPVKLLSIEPYATEQGARIVLRLSAPATFQVGTLAADGTAGKDARIFLDLARVNARGIARETPVGGVVRRVRVGANGGGTRVVVDLASSLYRRIFYLPDPFRVVIDLGTRPPSTGEKQGASGTREVRRIAIDPGHGGTDAGAVGPTGLREKDVTLDIAHRVAPLLAHELKIETLLTRDNDVYVPLDLRAARANAFHADLFVSIHCNASENGKATGVQTFILDEAREGAAARVAARENAQRARAEGALEGASLALVLSTLNPGELTARSRHVADLLQRSALGSLMPRYPDTKDQGIKTAGFYVLVGAEMPAVLFETAFISNPDDEGRLSTADYRQKLADAIANAIKAYKAGK
jgi:N-acetylmuramoyl-L-alanine amidase